MAGFLDRPDQLRQVALHLVVAEPADQRQSARLVLRVQDVDQAQQPIGLQRRATLETDRVLDAAAVFDVGVVGLARPVADPDHVTRGGVVLTRGRVEPREGLFVAKQQGLMGGVERRRTQLRRVVGGDAAGAHERHRLGDAIGEFLVVLPARAVLDEAHVPLVHALEIGITAGREGANQVQRRGRLAVGHDLPVRVRDAGLGRELRPVDDVAAVARQRDIALLLHRRGPRLGELAGDAADLHDRHAARIRQHDRHLQEDAEEIADVVGPVLGEAFGAIATLQQEAIASRHVGQRALQVARLTGKYERREGREASFGLGEDGRIGVVRHLNDRLRPPAVGRPAGGGRRGRRRRAWVCRMKGCRHKSSPEVCRRWSTPMSSVLPSWSDCMDRIGQQDLANRTGVPWRRLRVAPAVHRSVVTSRI